MPRLAIILLALALTAPAFATRVADITRLAGQREQQLVGMGLIVGLNGSGDGGDFLPAIRPLASMLEKFNNGANIAELQDADNVALVTVTALIPPAGVRNGDKVDIFVESIGAAQSLRGGRLFITPLQGPMAEGGVYALASGNIVIEDPATPTVGVIRGGAIMEEDMLADYVFDDCFTLIVSHAEASPGMTANIAKMINDSEDGREWAVAIDAKNVVVTIPPAERANPNNFVSRVQRLPVPMMAGEARVRINSRTGTIVITGEVTISPVIISHKGLTISTMEPQLPPTPGRPRQVDRDFIAIDPANAGGAKLQDLLESLDQLKVTAEDRIAIVKELHRTGKLHAKLMED
ncbi:MAG: flagellar basal body P-ring protein FlgI [Planctomycetota bacterium]